MCGVFGLACKKKYSDLNNPNIESYLSEGISSLRFRGPDFDKISEFEDVKSKIYFGHTRLAIIDINKHSNQPYSFDNLELTYNGEIYNYVELRNDLKKLGYEFKTNSDTEVLIKSWHHWGPKSLSKLNGMFSFAIFDRSANKIYLARDRFGVKPLFFFFEKEFFLFSSSASHIAQHTNSNIDDEYISRSLRYKVFETLDSESPFQDISSVGPGEYVIFDLSKDNITKEIFKWYDLESRVKARKDEIQSLSLEDIAEECLDILINSVNIRLRSDVPVAVSLSGGIDSSAISSIASKNIKNLEGFSYGSPNCNKSEGPIVSRFSKENQIKTNFIWPSYDKHDLEKMFEKTIAAQEAPFGGVSVIAQQEVYKNVKENGFKVLLGGQGGDEVFAGYRKFFLIAIRDSFKRRNLIDSIDFLYSFFRLLISEASFFKNYFVALNRYTSAGDKNKILSFKSSKLDLWGSKSLDFNARQIDDIQKWSLPTLLRFEDRNSMANSVESRLPFMDYRLVEFGLSISSNKKIKNGFGKWILRKATEGLIPDFIRLERKKRGFDVTSSWLADGLGEILIQNIMDNRGKVNQYIKNSSILDRQLSVEAIEHDKLLLDEVLMLNWLINPFKRL